MWHSIVDELPEKKEKVIVFDGEVYILAFLDKSKECENELVWKTHENTLEMSVEWFPYWHEIPELPDKLKELKEKIYYGPEHYGPEPAISLNSRSEQVLN